MKLLGRILFFIVLAVAAVGTWVNLSWKELSEFTNTPSESRIDYYLNDFTLTNTAPSGQIRYHLSGQHLIHKQASGGSEVYQPTIKVSSADGETVTLNAENALQQSKDGNITLKGAIRIHKPESDSSPDFTLTTRDLNYDPLRQHVSSDAEIDLVTAQGTIHGTGFETSLNEQELRIHSNVQADYQPTP